MFHGDSSSDTASSSLSMDGDSSNSGRTALSTGRRWKDRAQSWVRCRRRLRERRLVPDYWDWTNPREWPPFDFNQQVESNIIIFLKREDKINFFLFRLETQHRFIAWPASLSHFAKTIFSFYSPSAQDYIGLCKNCLPCFEPLSFRVSNDVVNATRKPTRGLKCRYIRARLLFRKNKNGEIWWKMKNLYSTLRPFDLLNNVHISWSDKKRI